MHLLFSCMVNGYCMSQRKILKEKMLDIDNLFYGFVLTMVWIRIWLFYIIKNN